MTYKIAIANEKGGVAKTTSVVSLGGAMAEMGKHILLIDLDPQANMTLALGLKPTQIDNSISRVILNSENPAAVTHQTNIENLHLIPSNAEMGLAERFLPIRQNYHSVLKNALHGWTEYPFYSLFFDHGRQQMGGIQQGSVKLSKQGMGHHNVKNKRKQAQKDGGPRDHSRQKTAAKRKNHEAAPNR